MPYSIPLPPPDLRDPTLVSLSIREVAVLLRLGDNAARGLVSSGQLPAVKVGGRIRVPAQAVRDLLGIEVSE